MCRGAAVRGSSCVKATWSESEKLNARGPRRVIPTIRDYMAFTWHASRTRSVCCVPVYVPAPPGRCLFTGIEVRREPLIHTLHDGGRANVDGRNGLSRNGLSCGGIRSWIVTGRAHRLHDATHVLRTFFTNR